MRHPPVLPVLLIACLIVVLGICWTARAGVLEPPGPPAPTPLTLQEIHDACTGGGACGVPKTGQTGCWWENGSSIVCAGTGQDGEYQAGAVVFPRFTTNLDGTVTDNLTGLIWLQDAGCFGDETWTAALADANTLADGSCGLTDGSEIGDWRLPNVRELHSLIDYGQSLPALTPGHLFSGVQSSNYWTSTSYTSPTLAWGVHFQTGFVNIYGKDSTHYVWPVRGGL